MSAIGWITAARRLAIRSVFRRAAARKGPGRKTVPSFEPLESIDLMSRGLLGLSSLGATGTPVPFKASQVVATVQATPPQSTAIQTATVPDTLTNFTVPFAPPITLFDPNLGTLTAVHVTIQGSLTSAIKSQNTSTTSAADITAFIDPTRSNFTVTGLSEPVTHSLGVTAGPVHVSPFNGTDPAFEGASTALWTPPPYPSSVPVGQRAPALTATNTQTLNLTSAVDLAFYTASPGRTTITPVLTANGFSGASAPNGNLQTDVRTSGSGVVTISYEYIPRCPNVVRLVRFGVHHQPTRLQLTFDGPIVPASEASNPANYWVIIPNHRGSFTGPGVRRVNVTSAVYDEANNTVTLTTAQRIYMHHVVRLAINLPCNDGNIVYIDFGGRNSLGGINVPTARGRVARAPR